MIHWGRFSFSSWLTGELVLTLTTKGFHQTYKDYFLHNSWGDCHCALDPQGNPFMILFLTGDLFENLNSRGSPFGDLWFAEGCFWCFQFVVDACVVFVSFTQLRALWSFWHVLGFFFCISYLSGTQWRFWGIFFCC